MMDKPKIVIMAENLMEAIWDEYRNTETKINQERLLHAFNQMATVLDLVKDGVQQ